MLFPCRFVSRFCLKCGRSCGMFLSVYIVCMRCPGKLELTRSWCRVLRCGFAKHEPRSCQSAFREDRCITPGVAPTQKQHCKSTRPCLHDGIGCVWQEPCVSCLGVQLRMVVSRLLGSISVAHLFLQRGVFWQSCLQQIDGCYCMDPGSWL